MHADCHSHGEYSLLDGAGTAKQHAEAARDAGAVALALTDHGTLAGALHHMRACREAGILPMVGCELYYRPNRLVQGQKEWLKNYDHLTVIAKDHAGWMNLMRLVSEAHKTGFYGRACADLDLLERYHEGLIVMTGCLGGQMAKRIVAEDDRGAHAWIRQLQRLFGDDLFFEIMPHDLDEQRIVNLTTIALADQYGHPYVKTGDEHYPLARFAPVQDVLLMIATNQTVKKREKRREEGEDVYEFTVKTLYHQTAQESLDLFASYHPQISHEVAQRSIDNTLLVAARVKPFLVDQNEKMAQVSFPDVVDNAKYLRQLCHEGLARKGYDDDPEYAKQVDYECDVIERLEAVDQILMAYKVVEWAKSDRPVPKLVRGKLVYEGKKRPIMVGPGRGSAAGSMACWAIGITNVNPRKHRTMFERFLNPDRKGKPDIDIDFGPDRVDEVEAFIKAVFGKDNVVDIIAHSTFGPRAAITDVGRVLCIPYEHVKAATKTIDDKERGRLEDIAAINPQVAQLADENPGAWEIMKDVQGQVARKSEHAGGVLILPREDKLGRKTKVEDWIPVERQGGQKGKLLSAYGERSGKGNALISDYGYNKLDVLRVAELTKQDYACLLYEQRTGERVELDELPVHDDPYAVEAEVMEGFARGLFVGVFQWSATAGPITRKIKPKDILELAAINALIRPGPRGALLDLKYANRKNGSEPVEFWHPSLVPHMDYTYGVLVFQEQLIEVVHHLGGLSRPQADIFRKIASKLYRDPEYARAVMGEWEIPIKQGFADNGIAADQIETIWGNLLSFADYSFNLAHADGYSILAYRDMWLKTHMAREFYAAFLSKGLSQITKKKVVQKQDAAREARMVGLKIMPPDVNESGSDYTVVEGGIRLGLQAVKNIGPAGSAAILEHAPFEDYDDFERRVPPRAVNVTGRASLVWAGAFDRWRMRDEFTEERIDMLERELLGMSLTSTYSLAQYASIIEERFYNEAELEELSDGTFVSVAGEVTGVKEWTDKKGETMAFVDLAYGADRFNITIFSHYYAEFKDLLESRRPIMITGEKSSYKGKESIKVKALPPDVNGVQTPPIMDFQDYVDTYSDAEEAVGLDSIFPEDVDEGVDYAAAMMIAGAQIEEDE